MPVMNTLKITQKAGAETTMKVTSTQMQCAALAVVAIVVTVDLMKVTKVVMEVAMKATMNRVMMDSAKTQTTV